MKRVTIVFENDDASNFNYELDCAMRGKQLNLAIGDVLDYIRGRLKYGEDVSELEEKALTEIRELISDLYIEG